MSAPDTINIALWSMNLGVHADSIAMWGKRVEQRAAEAVAGGAQMLLMPEYTAETWLGFKPDDLHPTREMAFLADHAPEAIDRLDVMSRKHGLTIVAGSMPWRRDDGSIANRAWTLLGDGTRIHHDKLALTPGEQDPESWQLARGDALRIFEWQGLRCAVLICLDVEMPALSVLLARQDIDLLLVPSMTHLPTGYSRVFGCAKARAIELMCAVAVVGCVGVAPGSTQNDQNHSACALYVPCETALGSFGIHTQTDMTNGADGNDPFVIARDIPVGAIRNLRAGAAEVWPGAWDASHIEIIDTTQAQAAAE